MKKIKETELFQRVNVLLLDRNKQQLQDLKEQLSLLGNIEVDNSALMRGMLDYFSDNPDELDKLVPYVKKTKGYHILKELHQMMDNNKTMGEIEKRLGISVELIEKLEEKQKGDSK